MPKFKPPTPEELELQAAKIGLPPREAQKFFCYYESKGWRVGSHQMKNWRIAMSGWKLRWEEQRGTRGSHDPRWYASPPAKGFSEVEADRALEGPV